MKCTTPCSPPNVRIHSWAQIVDSVLFDGVVINRRARVYKAILDKNVVLTENSTVGIDTEHDLARGFTVTPGWHHGCPEEHHRR